MFPADFSRSMDVLSLVSLAILTSGLVVAASDFMIESPAGRFQGKELTAHNGRSYVSFQGIPYAKPPVGELRFAKPQPHPRIDSVFDATKPPVVCTQAVTVLVDEEEETEDCLMLNIFMKQLDSGHSKKKNVLVFIHGGGFLIGGARDFKFGSFVAEQDVVVVTINYRLGIFGFLSTENEASPGNYGLWDQALALNWVKDNIASFGGNPDDVTVSGVSAGASSAAILSISPITKGLFSKVHMMSGSSTSHYANAMDPHLGTLRLAKNANCWEGDVSERVGVVDSEAILTCLRERPASELKRHLIFDVIRITFAPTIDGEFIPAPLFKLMENDQYLQSVGYFDRPYLVGFSNCEAGFWSYVVESAVQAIKNSDDNKMEEKVHALMSDMTASIRKWLLRVRLGKDESSMPLADKIMRWYDRRFGSKSFVEMMTDLSVIIATTEFADALARHDSGNVYFVYFNHYPIWLPMGTPHGLDILYWNDKNVTELTQFYPDIKGDFSEKDIQLKSLYSSVIAEFMKTGNPLSPALKAKLPSGWPAYDTDNRTYLDFSDDPIISYHFQPENWKLWTEQVPQWVAESEHDAAHTGL